MYPRILTPKERNAILAYVRGQRANDTLIRQLVFRYRKSGQEIKKDRDLLEQLIKAYKRTAHKQA
jgi:hypothetical protein